MSLIVSRTKLYILDDAARKQGWKRQSKGLWIAASVSQGTLKNFWAGKSMRRESFLAICNVLRVDWREVIDRNASSKEDIAPIKSWEGVPDLRPVYGRTENFEQLVDSIVKHKCRLCLLYGTKGIGKTALAVKVAEEIGACFDYMIWYSLSSSPPLEEVLSDIFTFLKRYSKFDFPTKIGDNLQQTADNSEKAVNISQSISQFIKFLNQHRCLLVLDGLEEVLSSGNYGSYQREHYRYRDLMKRVGAERHKSCLLITSREQPQEIALLKQQSSQFVCVHELRELEDEAARRILQQRNLSDPGKWSILIDTYRGNPLFLKVIIPTILDVFGGSVATFLRHQTYVTTNIAMLLNQSFKPLSNLERLILSQLVEQRKPISFDRLIEILRTPSNELIQAIEFLMSRSLIDKTTVTCESAAGYILPPVIREYVALRKQNS